jgi:hypothetical protein
MLVFIAPFIFIELFMYEEEDGISYFFLFLGAKSTSIRDCVGRSVRPSVGRSPRCDYVETRIRGNAIVSRRGGGRGN